MADSPSNPTGAYGEGVKWILAIAAAAIAGAFLHLKEIEEQNIWTQALLALALALFVYSIWTGMYYLLWLNLVPVAFERRKANREELKLLETPTGDGKKEEPDDQIKELNRLIDHDTETIKLSGNAKRAWHKHYTYSFSAALTFATLGLLLSIFLNAIAPKAKAKDRADATGSKRAHVAKGAGTSYNVVYSAVHATRNGREAHTFLLNGKTGELWQMMCDSNGRVAFHKVPITDK